MTDPVLLWGCVLAIMIGAGLGVRSATRSTAAAAGAVAVLAAWLCLNLALISRGVYQQMQAVPPRVAFAVWGPVVVVGLLLWLLPALRRLVSDLPLRVVLALHLTRVAVGAMFLQMHAQGLLPANFALAAGWGDILVGLWAGALALHGAPGRAMLLTWNVVALLDLVNAVILAMFSAPTPIQLFFVKPSTEIMVTMPYALVPTFIVPSMLLLHVFIFVRLARQATSEQPG